MDSSEENDEAEEVVPTSRWAAEVPGVYLNVLLRTDARRPPEEERADKWTGSMALVKA